MDYIQTIAIIIVCSLVVYNAYHLYQYYKWREADRIICEFYEAVHSNMFALPAVQDSWWEQCDPLCTNLLMYLNTLGMRNYQVRHIRQRHLQILQRAFGTYGTPFNGTRREMLMEMNKGLVYLNKARLAWIREEQYKAYMVI